MGKDENGTELEDGKRRVDGGRAFEVVKCVWKSISLEF